MSAPVEELAALAASLPPCAVLAHVVIGPTVLAEVRPHRSWARFEQRSWAKIGDEPWRSVHQVERNDKRLMIEPRAASQFDLSGTWSMYDIVTPSVTWEQSYGLAGRHEVFGVVG